MPCGQRRTGSRKHASDWNRAAAPGFDSWGSALAPVFAHGISLDEPAGSADVDVEEVQQPGLDAGGFGDYGGVAVVRGDQAQVGEGLENGPAGGSGGGAAVAGQAGHHLPVRGQRFADLPLGQAEDQQGQADHGDQGGDAAVGLQEQRGDRQGSFELAVAAFDGVLALVAAEDLLRAGLAGRQVGQQGVPAVGGGLGVDRGLVEVPGQDGFAGRAGGDGGAQVLPGAAFGGDRLDAGGHGIVGGVEPGPGGAYQPVEVPGGLGQLQRPGLGLAGGVR